MFAALALCLFVQCTDPLTPGAGFPVASALDQLVTFNDGATTRVDVRRPNAVAGACGWPIVVFIHGIGGNKTALGGLAQSFAMQGYFTLTFDVRGHGSATGDHAYFGARERWDMVEIVRWAQASYAGQADGSRIGVTGGSQGGIFSWEAAAWSGAALEAASGLTGSYPHIDAIVAENTSPDFEANFAPRALGVHSASGAIILGNGVRFDAAFKAQVDAALRAEDWATFHALMTVPSRDPFTLVGAITAPTMAMMAYDDFAFPAYALAEAWQTLAPGTPRKLFLGTGGHQSPTNLDQAALRVAWRRSWFDRFLKGISNGIDAGPTIAYAVTPNDTGQYLSANSIWTRKSANSWPPSATHSYRMFLRAGAALSPFAPEGAEASETIQQVCPASFDMNDLVDGGFQLALVDLQIGRSVLDYDSAPLASAIEFAGDARVHLSVSCPTDRYQVRASLWDVPPSGAPRYVCGGSYFVFDSAPVGANAFDVRLNANAYVFAIGHRVRVQLENLQIHQPPTGSSLRFAPYTHSFDLEICHNAAELSWLELPVSATMPIVYASGQVNSAGCPPFVDTQGTPSAANASAFAIRAHSVINQQFGLLFYGFAIADQPFHGGRLLVSQPLLRTTLQNSGGNAPPDDCSGSFVYDFNTRIASGVDPALVVGTRVFAQYWSRDPAAPSTTNVTNAVEFSVGP